MHFHSDLLISLPSHPLSFFIVFPFYCLLPFSIHSSSDLCSLVSLPPGGSLGLCSFLMEATSSCKSYRLSSSAGVLGSFLLLPASFRFPLSCFSPFVWVSRCLLEASSRIWRASAFQPCLPSPYLFGPSGAICQLNHQLAICARASFPSFVHHLSFPPSPYLLGASDQIAQEAASR